MQNKVMPRPNPKQEQFFMSRTRFTAYGGARGGGKSWAVRKKAQLMAIQYPGIRMIILRRTLPELRENHILPLMADLMGVAQYKDSEKAFIFPNGSRLRFGYCDNDRDVHQYQGQEFDVMFFDEATHFTEYQFTTITACLRGTNDFPKRIYVTCNPGGVGHYWVKRLFIDRDYKKDEKPEDYTFIAAGVRDNKALMDNDPEYITMLKNLPDGLRRAWLDGDWNALAGQYFTEFRREIHVMRPIELPAHWRRYITLDYGLDMLACYWIAVDEQRRAYVYREIYESNLRISQAAAKIKAMTHEPIDVRYAPPDLWNRRQDSGQSAAEIFAGEGVPLIRARNERVQGWYALAEWLAPCQDEFGDTIAHLRIFDTCPNLIRCLPAVLADERNPNDVATEPHELTHAPDAIRYFVAGRPLPTVVVPERDPDDAPEYDDQVRGFLDYGL